MINTQRTVIKPLNEEDIPAIIEMYAEPDSNKYIAPLVGKSVNEYTVFLQNKIETNKGDLGFWSVFSKDSNVFIGTVNLNQFAKLNVIHIGCHLKREYWNQEYGFELMEALINYGFEERKLDFIYAIIEEGHVVSNKLFDSLGFKFKEKRNIDGSDLGFYQLDPKRWEYINIDKFVTVSTFQYPSDAYVIRAKLEANGIECFLKDEISVQVYNFNSNALGGVKLQVRQSKKYEAINILRDSGYHVEGESEPSVLWSTIDEFTIKIPFLKKLPVELRLVILITLILLIIFLPILLITNG
jgi:RimJ/RimL family protein N-acetyltransferase